MKRLFLAGALLAGVCLGGGTASAQTGTARGKVVDNDGKGLPEATVKIEYQGPMTRKFDTKTNKKGEFTQVGLQPGVYRFTGTKEGYADAFVEAKISLGEPTYLPEIKLATKAAAQAAAADKSVEELRGNFEKANALMNEGKLDEAEAAYRELIAKDPSIPQLHHNLAIVLTRKKDMAGAEAEYLKAVEVKPDYTDGYAGLTNLYLANGQADKAVDVLGKAAAARPDDAKVQFNLGLAQFTKGALEPAGEAFAKAATLDPANPEPHYYLGTIALSNNKPADCVSELEKYLGMKPTNAQNAAVAPGLLTACKGSVK
jgi:tetratricopeptide (TPR) repeat protein